MNLMLRLIQGAIDMKLMIQWAVTSSTLILIVLAVRRLFRDKQPIAIPFLPFLACGCSVATLAELFL